MPIQQNIGLRGLPGLNSVSEEERNAFMLSNADKLQQYTNIGKRKKAAEVLFNNQQFIKAFGKDAFDKMNDGTKASYDARNTLLKNKVVDDAFKERYAPVNSKGLRDNSKGLGEEWEKYYNDLNTDSKLELLNSGWKTNEQLKKEQDDRDSWWEKTVDFVAGEAIQQHKKESNQKIIDRIYNKQADNAGKELGTQVAAAYGDTSITGRNDEETKALFRKAIMPSSTNMGIAEFASHYGETDDDITSEMKDFSIEDMRQVLAKKYVYEQSMSPQMANVALNNEAKRYLKEHQGDWKRYGLFGKDVIISAMSYTMDKINGIYNLGLVAADKLSSDKPEVLVDDAGNVLDPKTPLSSDGKGGFVYKAPDGKIHSVHREAVDRATLHNMGKNFDGSEDNSVLNAKYWTRAEQFGTLDEKQQEKYEKLGSSPYKVVYDPNDESDLWYESFKMMSFGLADGVSMFIPFGIGMAGRALSTASKAGKLANGVGKAMNAAGKYLTYQTKTGQFLQGGAGALGIAYAYNRGAFQESLAKNLSDIDSTVQDISKKSIYSKYNNDSSYKKQVDGLIANRASEIAREEMARLSDSNGGAVDPQAFQATVMNRAQQEVLNDLVQKDVAARKSSNEYAQLQQKAIDEAGDAATNSFLPEAIKYGFVNTVGYRKFLYTNPAGLQRKVSSAFKGMQEVTTAEGKQRLTAGASKFSTIGGKMKQFGKVTAKQFWGGAWTNGTDDMMVDAAQRMSQDSFDRYLNAYSTGEGIADTYGTADALYSYWRGLQNSLGQETTWNAAAVGGFGSLVSVTPNTANIAHLATKEGREAFKNAYTKRPKYETDEQGFRKLVKDEHGKPIMEDVSFGENWLERFNYFIQNGVLNTYYGAKQSERELQSHADFVNNLLDDYNDFKVIGDLVVSDLERENADNVRDKKTMQFIQAIHTMNALDHLANSENDPTTMSSVVANAKDMIRKASKLGSKESNEDALSEDELKNMISQYYSNNPGLEITEANNQVAIANIAKNAQKLMKASEAYDEAEKHVSAVERERNAPINPIVRDRMKLDKALDAHWRERIATMKSELEDSSDENTQVSSETFVATVGGRRNASSLLRVYDRQESELNDEVEKNKKNLSDLQDKLNKAQEAVNKAESSDDKYNTQIALKEAQDAYDDAKQHEEYLKDLILNTRKKRQQVKDALTAEESRRDVEKDRVADAADAKAEEAEQTLEKASQAYKDVQERAKKAKNLKDRRKITPELNRAKKAEAVARAEATKLRERADALAKEAEDAAKTRILTADEIFALDPVTRARMMAKDRRSLYSEEQQQEIKKLEDRLLLKDGQALTKIQDIARLTQRVAMNADAYARLAKNPDAAAIAFEVQQQQEADAATKLIDQRLAEDLANLINQFDDNLASHEDVDEEFKQDFVYKTLRKYGKLVDIIDEQGMLPKYQRALDKAKDWGKIIEDLTAVVKALDATPEEKDNISKNLDNLIESASTKEEVMTTLERVVDEVDNPIATEDFEKIFKGLEELGYQRDATVIEKREERKKRLEEAKQREEAAKKKLEEEAKQKAAEAAAKAKAEAESKAKLTSVEDVPLDLSSEGESETKPSDSEKPVDEETPIEEVPIEEKEVPEKPKEETQPEEETPVVEEEAPVVEEGPASSIFTEETDEYVAGKVPTVEEQIEDTSSNGKKWEASEETVDEDFGNSLSESISDGTPNTLSANAMSEWQSNPLAEKGILIHKEGENEGDAMNRYYAWMDAAGIRLQNIIDDEFAKMLSEDPDRPIKFMIVRPEKNATHDDDVKTHLFLVIDYDSKAARHHDEKNGGVIESQGKKYLVVGTVGYKRGDTAKQALRDILFSNNPDSPNGYGLMKRGTGEFWRNNPSERFYVHPTLETRVVPNSLIPGYLVKQMEKDEGKIFRSILDLVSDENIDRNPHHLTLNSLQFGIQMYTKFATPVSLDKVMCPRDVVGNAGRAFVLLPASNGKLVPAYFKPLMYNELVDGSALQRKIEDLLTQVTAPKYADRYKALLELNRIFYFDTKKGDAILLKKRKNVISLVHDGKISDTDTFTLDSSFNRDAFFKAFAKLNPRINITISILKDRRSLAEYAEAGALMVDCAKLGTAGSSYSIYALDATGKMLVSNPANNSSSRDSGEKSFKETNLSQVVYDKQYYTYDSSTGTFYLNSVPVTNEALLTDLRYNQRVFSSKLVPADKRGEWVYYILESGEKPELIKINENTQKVVVANEAQAKEFIEDLRRKREQKEREAAAKEALDSLKLSDKEVVQNVEDVQLFVDEETGDLNYTEPTSEENQDKEEKKEKKEESLAESKTKKQSSFIHKEVANSEASSENKATQNFESLFGNRKHTLSIYNLVKNKWPDAPTTVSALKQFLKDKHIPVEAIGTSDTDIQAWMKTIEECR